MAKINKKGNNLGTIFANAAAVGGCVAIFMVACSAIYYSAKGTVGLLKAIGKVGSNIINR